MTDSTAGHTLGPWRFGTSIDGSNLDWDQSDLVTVATRDTAVGPLNTAVAIGSGDPYENPADKNLIVLADHAPHDCGREECPGYRLLLALRFLDDVFALYEEGYCRDCNRALDAAHAPGCRVATIEEAIR